MKIECFTTTDCNLSCAYCHVRDLKIDFSCSEYYSTLNDLINYFPIDTVIFTGGEPFLWPERIEKTLKILSGNKIDSSVTTNGTIITNQSMSLICEYDMRVKVSLDGDSIFSNKYRFNCIRSLNLIKSNIKYLLDNKVQTKIGITITDENVKRIIPEIIELHAEFPKIHSFEIGPVYGVMGVSAVDFVNFVNQAKIASNNLGISISPMDSPAYLQHGHSCGAFVNNIALLPDGSMVGCSSLAPFRFTSKYAKNVNQIEMCANALHEQNSNDKHCLGCRSNCNHGCPAIKLYGGSEAFCSALKSDYLSHIK